MAFYSFKMAWELHILENKGHAFPLLKPFSWLWIPISAHKSPVTGPRCLFTDFAQCFEGPGQTKCVPPWDFPPAIPAACNAPSPDLWWVGYAFYSGLSVSAISRSFSDH